jgi:hypothetical protein
LSDNPIATTIVGAVKRRRVVVPVLLALSGLGWAAAHAVAHRLMMPERDAPPLGLHDYLAYLTTSTALCLALALPLAAGAAAGRRWRGASLRSLWFFGLVPLLGFAGHSLVEPALAGDGLATGVADVAPVVLVGLLIQTSFALSAVAVARLVLSVGEGLAHALAAPAHHRAKRRPTVTPRPRPRRAPTFSLATVHTGRGPPLLPA